MKDPIDLTFLFWSISAGIICGAGLGEIAIAASLTVTVMILFWDNVKLVRTPLLLILNFPHLEAEEEILATVSEYYKYYKVKSRNLTKDMVHMIVELRTDRGSELLKALEGKESIGSITLMEHDGEATF